MVHAKWLFSGTEERNNLKVNWFHQLSELFFLQPDMSFRRNPSKYGVSSSHADEDALPTATQTSFFQKGREFESRYVNHHYTQEEREKLGTFESVDYLPPHSAVYKVCQVCILLVQLFKYLFCLTCVHFKVYTEIRDLLKNYCSWPLYDFE